MIHNGLLTSVLRLSSYVTMRIPKSKENISLYAAIERRKSASKKYKLNQQSKTTAVFAPIDNWDTTLNLSKCTFRASLRLNSGVSVSALQEYEEIPRKRKAGSIKPHHIFTPPYSEVFTRRWTLDSCGRKNTEQHTKHWSIDRLKPDALLEYFHMGKNTFVFTGACTTGFGAMLARNC